MEKLDREDLVVRDRIETRGNSKKLRDHTYEERLEKLGLTTLERRREREGT